MTFVTFDTSSNLAPSSNPTPSKGRRIAVIGAGISGMGAAHMLASDNQVTLCEAGARLGGTRAQLLPARTATSQ